MKAIRVRAFGGPEVLELATIPEPHAGPGQIVVKLMAAGVNPVDTYIRSGSYGRLPELPYTPGSDGAGVIAAIGTGIGGDLTIGQKVWLSGSPGGTYAEATVCDGASANPLPDGLSYAQGAALGIPYLTAFRALFQRGGAAPGETVLVHGATGGVGVAAVQFARAAGLRVLATGGSEAGLTMLRAQGAAAVFDHSDPGCTDLILESTGGRGVDLIVEMLANENLARDLALLARSGRIVVVGSRGPVAVNPREAMVREADIRGVFLANAPESQQAEARAAVTAGLRSGNLVPVIGREFRLDDAPEAHRAQVTGGHRGKVVLHCQRPA